MEPPRRDRRGGILVAMVDLGNVAEWVSGIGALAAAGAALVISHRAEQAAETAAAEARKAAARGRTMQLMVGLIQAVERDLVKVENLTSVLDDARSAEATGLCRALWSYRGSFGTVWHFYCEDDRRWIADLHGHGELFPRMRDELQRAADLLDFRDRSGTGQAPPEDG